MTLADIADFACQTTGDISSDALAYAKKAVRLKYATLYDAHNWREAMRTIDGQPLDPALNGAFFLPYDAEEVIYCSLSYDGLNYIRLTYRERDWIERFIVPVFTLPGNAPWFYRAENLGWPYLNPGRFTFTSADQSPFNVYIAGLDGNDQPISESFSLQGTTNLDGSVSPISISTRYSYQLVTVISKAVTQTPLSVRAETPSTLLISMSPATTGFVFTQLVIYPPPLFSGGTPYVRTLVKLKPDQLDDDMSVPRISHIWDALMCFTTAALWKRGQQLSKAKSDEADAMEHVKAAINIEKNQSEMRQQVVPIIYDRGDYLYSGGGVQATSYNPFGGP